MVGNDDLDSRIYAADAVEYATGTSKRITIIGVKNDLESASGRGPGLSPVWVRRTSW